METVSFVSVFILLYLCCSLYLCLSIHASVYQYTHTDLKVLLLMLIQYKPVGHIIAHKHNLIYALYMELRKNKSRYLNHTLPQLLVHFAAPSVTKQTLTALLHNASWS